MKRVYLGGPMRGLRLFNFQEFESGKAYLEWLGHEVVSPHDIDISDGSVDALWRIEEESHSYGQKIRRFTHVSLTDTFTIEGAMRRDIAALLTCDAIAFLPGWCDSQGAKTEYRVAEAIGLEMYEVHPWRAFHTMRSLLKAA